VASILEIARALKHTSPLRHTVVFLLDDGEEPLLLGARAFMTEHPWASSVRAAVNLDAGGSSGPSVLLRTSRDNDDLVTLFARTVTRPVTSSFLAAGFRQLQHNTSFTEFTRGGVQAFDFAYFAHRLHYHTPLDNLENVDLGSLQHRGEQALALVRALADRNLDEARTAGDAVFFDLFAIQTVRWPVRWTRPFTLAGAVGVLLTIGLQRRRRRLTWGAVAWGVAVWLGSIVMALGFGLVLSRALRTAHAIPGPWIATPWPAAFACAAFGVATAGLLAALVSRRVEAWALWAGTWMGWTVLACLIAWPAPEASYVALVPLWAAAIGGLVTTVWTSESGEPSARAALFTTVTAATVMIPAIGFVYQAVGTPVFPVITATAALLTTAAFPLITRQRRWSLPAMSVAVGMVLTGIAVVTPAYSARAPQAANLIFHQDADSGTARWIVSSRGVEIPATWRPPGNFVPVDQPFPWPSSPALVSDAARVATPAPEFLILETTDRPTGREVRGVLRSPRGASQVSLMIPPGFRVDAVNVRGTTAPPIRPRFLRQSQGWRTYTCLTPSLEGVEVRLVLSTAGPIDIVVLDQSSGVPPEGHQLLASRPPAAVPVGDGDVTLITRRVRLVR
jgi:hypothetical protein